MSNDLTHFMEIFFSPVFDVDNQLQKVKCAQSIGVNNFKYISFSQSVPNLRTSLLKLHSLVMPDLSNAQMYTFCPGTPSRGWFPRLKNFSNLRVTPLTKVWMGYDGTNFRNNFFLNIFCFCILSPHEAPVNKLLSLMVCADSDSGSGPGQYFTF